MGFTDKEKEALLAVKGVGPTVIQRFEEIGICSFDQLKKCQTNDVAEMIANMLNSTCWKNSPQSKNAIRGAIERAKQPL
ncbi:helix-hairpin-helix domain-containing protein [Sessilibacter corallicola]|uniref:helix-hairpin-helix domain-containing protein n=1 Tax=Sessilibacter corallicola TaxID=2904075 RepID=UPI001E34103B|nr:helix-hairpin-helix domain-containing protein [Sessilibacter corallicola]MCE2028662.1 helix-hairpin-helix domain-containing protein [Sessilibacter corallicola]